MDTPMVAIIFAEDLLTTVVKVSGVTWTDERPIEQCLLRANVVPRARRCTFSVIEAVILLMVANGDTIRHCYDTLVSQGKDTKSRFRREATITTVFHLKNGYDPLKYLQLCALFAGVAVQFFRVKGQDAGNEIAEVVMQLLAYVVNMFIYQMKFDPRVDWFNLSLKAQDVRRDLLDKVNEVFF